MLASYIVLSELERGEEVEGIRHKMIDTGDSPPIRQPHRRVPFSLRPTIKELLSRRHAQDQGNARVKQPLE